jgi:glutamate/aspartate transport system ATP-binding protein
MVFQHFELFPHMSITDNLTIAQVKVLGRSKEKAMDKGLKLLERVGLKAHAHKFGPALGRPAAARGDRPGAGDGPDLHALRRAHLGPRPEMINEVLDVMVELAQEGMTMMCVTHEMGFAKKVANRVIFMDQGRIVEDDSKGLSSAPRSERARQFLARILSH